MPFVLLGPGTLTVGAAGAEDFSCEVLGGRVTHAYDEVGDARTMLCGDVRPASRRRADGFSFNVENDLGAAGMYAYLMDNDLAEAEVTYTPNTAAGASWTGTVTLTLPADIGADEYGQPIVSSVEWAAVGPVEFTPATAVPGVPAER